MIPKFDMLQCVSGQLANAGLRFDAGETASFARELEYIQIQAIEAKYPEFKYASLVPIKTDAPVGAQSHTYREVEDFGDAEFLENMAPEDFPTAEVKGAETTGKFRSLGTKYSYSIEDLRRESMMQSIKPTERKSKTARRVVESRFDRAVFGGGGPFSGLAQNANSVDDTTAAGTAGSSDWTALDFADPAKRDADKIVNTFRYVADNAFTVSNGAFEQFDFVLSPAQFTFLGQRSAVTGSDKTIADYIMASVPRVRSISWTGRLTGISDSTHDRMLVYPRDPEVLEAYVPIAFEQFPPQLRGMVFEIFCHAKYGGLRIYHPNMIRRVDIKVRAS